MAIEKNETTLDDAPAKSTSKAAPVAPAVAELIKHNSDLSGKRKVLTIHKGEQGSQSFVFIGLNGTGYQVPRGLPCNVPVELVHNLRNANQTFYERDEKGVMQAIESPRFAFSVEDAPDAA
jgi:hypothetical protein